jgi:hypothetical protein
MTTTINYYRDSQNNLASFELQDDVFPGFTDLPDDASRALLLSAYSSSFSQDPILSYAGNNLLTGYPFQAERRTLNSLTPLLSLTDQSTAIYNSTRYTSPSYFNNVDSFLPSISFNKDVYRQLYTDHQVVAFQNTYTTEFLTQNETVRSYTRGSINDPQVFFENPPQLPYLYYCKKKLVGTVDNLPVFSTLVPEAFVTFKDKCIKLDDITYHYAPFVKSSFPGTHRRCYAIKSNLKSTIKSGVFADISTENAKLMDIIANSTAKRFTVIEVPGWSSAAKLNDPLKIVEYTKSQVQKRKACLIPALFKMQFRDENFQLKDCYHFSLVLNVKLFFSTIASINSFSNLINSLGEGDGLKFFNPEAYKEAIYKKLGILSYYSSQMVASLPEAQLNMLLHKYTTQTKSTHLNSADCDDIFSIKLNVNPTITTNLDKANAKYEEIKNNIKTYKKHFLETFNQKSSAVTTYIDYKRRLKEVKDTYENTTLHNLTTVIDNISFSTRVAQVVKEFENAYEADKKRALSEKDYVKDEFFNNLAKDGIYIESISFKTKNGNTKTLTANTFDKTQILDHLLSNDRSSLIQSISNITLVTTKPQKIKVDNDPNMIVVGGPYRVYAEPNLLQVSLAELPAVWGYNPNNTDYIYVHPHAASVTISSTTVLDKARACLGEAAPMLHKAGTTGDIKMMIYTILIWLRSANSADPWGRNYVHFPKLSDVDFEGITMEKFNKIREEQSLEVNEEDIDSFLLTDLGDPEEDDDSEEDLPSTDDPVVEDQTITIEQIFDTASPPAYVRWSNLANQPTDPTR